MCFSLKTNSRNTNVKHIRGTKAWKQTVETQMYTTPEEQKPENKQ
jgi:hypothetical protein